MARRELETTFPYQPPADASSSSSTSSNDVSPSIMITVLILAIAVILSASLYLLLRFLRRNRISATETTASEGLPRSLSSSSDKSLRQVSPIIDSLPLFTYDRLTTNHGRDCAVCLSKFENNDVLRLLPICCHAFHAECIDTWLSANLTCPLCRSPILLSEDEIIGKLDGVENSRSFRVEIGNVSRNRGGDSVTSGESHRSYSLGGSFDYVIPGDDEFIAVAEPQTGSFRRTSSEYYKESDLIAEQRGALAAEVGARGGGGGNWLKDYLSYSLSSSRTASFQGSGRWFFTGSSRRSTTELPVVNRENELEEASRLGDEIGELFRWLSGA